MRDQRRGFVRVVARLALLALLMGPAAAAAQEGCPPQPDLSKSTETVETSLAISAIKWLVGKLGVDVNVRKERDSVLRDNPRADQAFVIIQGMATYCMFLAADTTLSPAEKAERWVRTVQQLRQPAQGPDPMAVIDGPRGTRG